jgi:hypothetical protein
MQGGAHLVRRHEDIGPALRIENEAMAIAMTLQDAAQFFEQPDAG